MSSGAIDPINNPEAWDTLRVGQTISPGVAEIGDIKTKNEWDVKKGKGVYGSTLTFVGRPPSHFSVTFKLWTADHFVKWDLFRPLFKYDPAKKAIQAIDVYHPALADIELTSVVCEGVGAVHHEGGGLYTIVVDFIEFFPAQKTSAVGTPGGSTPGKGLNNGKVPGGDPIADAQQAEIARLAAIAAQP